MRGALPQCLVTFPMSTFDHVPDLLRHILMPPKVWRLPTSAEPLRLSGQAWNSWLEWYSSTQTFRLLHCCRKLAWLLVAAQCLRLSFPICTSSLITLPPALPQVRNDPIDAV
jgi:hypothetical protein